MVFLIYKVHKKNYKIVQGRIQIIALIFMFFLNDIKLQHLFASNFLSSLAHLTRLSQ